MNAQRMLSQLLVLFACAAVSHAQSGGDLLKDMGGKSIKFYKGEAEVVNHQTGEPADGSEIARKIRPGVIDLFKGEIVTVIQTDEQGNALPAGAASRFVSHLDTLTADGDLYRSGEAVPLSVAVDHGILKNPGPETAYVTIIIEGRTESLAIEPGDALAANFDELLELVAPISSRIVCDCECRGNGRVADIRFNCDGSAANSILELLAACDCSNADDFSCDIDIDDDGVDDIVDGDVANCRTKVVNN